MSLKTTPRVSRSRKRTIKAAKDFLTKELRRPLMREEVQRLRLVKQPGREARKIVDRALRIEGRMVRQNGKAVDLADFQELRTALVRRDCGLYSPHSDFIRRMENIFLRDGMSRAEFDRLAGTVLKMPQPLSEDLLLAEAKLRETGEWS
jgi:hypothetical protein